MASAYCHDQKDFVTVDGLNQETVPRQKQKSVFSAANSLEQHDFYTIMRHHQNDVAVANGSEQKDFSASYGHQQKDFASIVHDKKACYASHNLHNDSPSLDIQKRFFALVGSLHLHRPNQKHCVDVALHYPFFDLTSCAGD